MNTAFNFSDLNNNEKQVLFAIAKASDYNGGDFTYATEIDNDDLGEITQRQLKGYISQLVQKGYILCEVDGKQIFASNKVDFLTEYLG
jgi:hypothetical protein